MDEPTHSPPVLEFQNKAADSTKTTATLFTSLKLLRLLPWKHSIPLVLSAIGSTPIALLNRGSRFIEQGFLFPLSILVLSMGACLLAEYWPACNSSVIWMLAVLAGVGMWSLLGVVTITFYAKLKETSIISLLRKLRRLLHGMPKGDLLPPFPAEDLSRAENLKNSKDIEFFRHTWDDLRKSKRQWMRQLRMFNEQIDNLLALFTSLRQSLWLNFYGTQIAVVILTYFVTLTSFGLLYRAVSHQNPAAFLPPDELGLLDAIYLGFLSALTMGGGDLHPQATIVKWAYLLEMITTFLSLTIFLGIGVTVFQAATAEEIGAIGPPILRNKRRAIRQLVLSILNALPSIFVVPELHKQTLIELAKIHAKLEFAKSAPALLAMGLVILCKGKTASQVGSDGIKTLTSALDYEHPLVRATAARCLGEIKATAEVERLTALLQDLDADVRLAAGDSLSAIRSAESTKTESQIRPESDHT
jgi:hypothetical protein